jgi:hypothetical protein
MANVTTKGRGIITITGLDADWLYTTDGGFDSEVGLMCKSIQFNPGAAADRMIIRDGGLDSAKVFDSGPAAGTVPIVEYLDGKWVRPVIDISDCTLGAGTLANCEVIIHLM